MMQSSLKILRAFKAVGNALNALTRTVGNLQNFVNKGNKINILVNPEEGFISIQLNTEEVK